ncbi:hypothetical protein EPN96_00935 [bacterium]|nr:MAG: hypothetical protein EPN96_00935 [bacterium]
MRKILLLSAALALCAPFIAGARAEQSFSGRLSATVEWFDTPEGDQAVPAYLYGFLNVRDLGGYSGLKFRGYGRLADDLQNEVDRDSRLYYAYIEKEKLLEKLDLRLGRQFVSTAAGAGIIDGVDLTSRGLGPVTLKAFGGVRVSQKDEYEAGDKSYGASAKLALHDDGDLSVAYFQEWESSDLSKELAGVDGRYDFSDSFELFAAAQYNLLLMQPSHFFAEADYHPSQRHSLRARYLYDIPVFRSTSIYSVFAVSEYREAGLEYECRMGEGYLAVARYTNEMYEDYSDANVYEAGAEKLRTGVWSGYLLGTFRDDEDGQSLKGIKLRYAYLVNRYFEPGFGVNYDVLERRIEEKDETLSRRYWVFAKSELTDSFSLEANFERADSALYDEYYLGRVRLNYRF